MDIVGAAFNLVTRVVLFQQVSYVSCSSTFTTHPLPMDQSMLKNSDALIMTGITEAPTANPDAMLGEFCTHLGKCS